MAGNVDDDPFKKGTQIGSELGGRRFTGVLVYSHRRTPPLQEDPQNSSRVSHNHVRRQLCQAVKGGSLMSARTLLPFTMTAGGRALSLLSSTVAATPSSSRVLVSRLSLMNPNSTSIVSGSMASGQKCGILVCHFQSHFLENCSACSPQFGFNGKI
ncbi:hypothetical protein Adt_36580 [Abeliophyllum distichum]|uniref:Uncharacterized protein n=1 Tax=Abeliophyllum distichum TaxID=126358 RepID=A0ABD1QIV2_9LAMI